MMGALQLKYLSVERNRHGRQVIYVIGGTSPRRRIRIREELDSPSFMAAYQAAVTALKNGYFSEPRSGKRPEGFVYFLLYGNGNGAKIKIGTSKNVNGRFAVLKTGVPGKARVYYVTPGNIGLERDLHRKFAEDRISGEWFLFSAAIRDWIAQDRNRRTLKRGGQKEDRSANIVPFAPQMHRVAKPLIQ
jgi:Meiotically up-regulated gene 113